ISPRSARVTRARISAAALRVKVMARICAGSSTAHSSFKKRCVSTAVLPEPAGACRRSERRGSVAARRASRSACRAAAASLRSASLMRVDLRFALGDAADVHDVAEGAGPGPGVDRGPALQEVADQPLDQGAPRALLSEPGIPAHAVRGLHGPD